MTNDFNAVLWKEWRENILQYGSVRRWLLNMLLLIGVIGIFMPLQFGRMTIESLFLLMWIWMPMLNVVTLIADSIAGERERHTLETLLASRLPDQAIVLGKITVIVVQSWLVMLASAVLALVTVNLFKREGPELILYPAPVAFGILVLPLLLGVLVAGVGVLASMHAATVRQAYQRMAILLVAVVVVPSLGLSMLPQDFITSLYSADFAQNKLGSILVISAVVLVFLDAAILSVGLSRFRRSHLIVD
jgi:ABC-2 type transport system permease protein